MHIRTLLHQIWISALDCRNPEEKSLEELTTKLRQPKKHQRCMTLIQTKRGSEKHSDFLEKTSENYSLAECDEMSGNEFQIHLFINSANAHMAKIATELLEKENLTM